MKKTAKKAAKKAVKKTIKKPVKKLVQKPIKKVPAKKPKAVAPDPIRNLAKSIFEAMEDTKALDAVVYDLRGVTTFTDYLVICGGTSERQVKSIGENIRKAVKINYGRLPLGTEGQTLGTWVLMDYGDVVCHVFLEETRRFYQLEELWHDAKRVKF